MEGSSSSANLPVSSRPSLSGTVGKLRRYSDNPKKVQEALILIRKHFLKEKNGLDRLRQYGGVEVLLDIIRGTNQTCADIALSILANICMDTKVQTLVLNSDGVTTLGKVLENTTSEDMVNRACRALGNLAQNSVNCRAIHEEENIIAQLVSHANTTSDCNFQLTLIRTLRLIGDNASHRTALLNEEGLRAVALHLKSEDERVIKAAYQGVIALSKEFNDVCARQIVAADAPAVVLEHTSHSDSSIKKTAFKILMNSWMAHHELRVSIGNAGGVQFFIDRINTQEDKRSQLMMANGLCLCCCEVVNRVRVKDNGGLQMMLKMLQNEDFSPLYARLISALTCFLYDESGWEILMKNQLVDIVLKHLQRVSNLQSLPEIETQKNIIENKMEKSIATSHALDDIGKLKCSSKEGEEQEGTSFGDDDSEVKVRKKSDDSEKVKPGSSVGGDDVESECDKTTNLISDSQLATSSEPSKDDTSKKDTVMRYSVDSPTYKSVIDWTPDDYMSGPKNILDSEHYQCASPDRLSAFSSPSNLGPYSPLSISSCDLSPDTSPPRSASLYLSSPEKDFPSSPESPRQGSSSDNVPPIWSPIHSTCNESNSLPSDPNSPDVLSRSSFPLFFTGDDLRYSSSDEDDAVTDYDSCRSKVLKSETSSESLASSVSQDPFTAKTEIAGTSAAKSDFHRLSSDTSDSDMLNDSRPSTKHRRTPLSSRSGIKRKRDLTPEMRKRIMLNVEKSKKASSHFTDFTQIMSDSVFSASKEETSTMSDELPPVKKDYRRQTEYCLIMLIKKVSCSDDPTEDLVRHSVLGTLMDYISFAEQPLPKCGRILIRLTKNTSCFEAMILKLVPQLISERLVGKVKRQHGNRSKEERRASTSRQDNKGKSPEVMNRSMSACTLADTSKVVHFHREVKRHVRQLTQPNPQKADDGNCKEGGQIKEVLLSNLSFLAETPFGQGILSHLLLTGTEKERMHTAVALSLICRSRSLQTKMYIEHRGLQNLLTAIQKGDPDFQRNAICGLATLVSLKTKKQISAPTNKSSSESKTAVETDVKETQNVSASNVNDQTLCDAIFEMDDGAEVYSCRRTLVERSDVFAAMLEGHYSEAGQKKIHIPGVSRGAFIIVINHLHGKDIGEGHTLDHVIEAHGLADRYILDDLTRQLCDLLVSSYLKVETVYKIFSHAVLHEAYWVMKQCVSFLLVGPLITDTERLLTLQELLHGFDIEVLTDVIEEIFKN